MSTLAARPHSAQTQLGASQLAAQLGVPLLPAGKERPGFQLILEVAAEGLTLLPTDRRLGKGLCIDFVRGSTAHRRRTAASGPQPLLKAVSIGRKKPRVIDATAGLGRDAFHLASLGCEVLSIERSAALFAMLQDAWQKASIHGGLELRAVMNRLTFVHGDSKLVLANWPAIDRPDVVYLDPMYIPRQSSALVKKEMRILRLLVGDDDDAVNLLHTARRVARTKVVVKRHLRAAPLSPDVSHTYRGRTVRYDVYPALTGV